MAVATRLFAEPLAVATALIVVVVETEIEPPVYRVEEAEAGGRVPSMV